MAGIEKMYGTHKQYLELKKWLKKNKPLALKEMYPEEMYDDKSNRCIARFKTRTDMWLLEHCKIPWVLKRIRWQYGMEE